MKVITLLKMIIARLALRTVIQTNDEKITSEFYEIRDMLIKLEG